MAVPALPRHPFVPQPADGRALRVREDGAEAEEQVDGDDDEPDKLSHPALGKVQQQNGKRGLAPGRGRDGEDAGQVGNEEVVDKVVYVPRVLAEAVVDVDGQRGRLGDEGELMIDQ